VYTALLNCTPLYLPTASHKIVYCYCVFSCGLEGGRCVCVCVSGGGWTVYGIGGGWTMWVSVSVCVCGSRWREGEWGCTVRMWPHDLYRGGPHGYPLVLQYIALYGRCGVCRYRIEGISLRPTPHRYTFPYSYTYIPHHSHVHT
jgi:hypothetical protein